MFPCGIRDVPEGTIAATRDFTDPRLKPPLVLPPMFAVPSNPPDCHILGGHQVDPSHQALRMIHVGAMSDVLWIQLGSVVFGRWVYPEGHMRWWYHTGQGRPWEWDPVPPVWFSHLAGFDHAGWWQPKPEITQMSAYEITQMGADHGPATMPDR